MAVGAPLPALFIDLAAATGGRAFGARDRARARGDALRSLAAVLRAQYLLGYTPGTRSARRARVAQRSRRGAAALGSPVRTRQGYWTR